MNMASWLARALYQFFTLGDSQVWVFTLRSLGCGSFLFFSPPCVLESVAVFHSVLQTVQAHGSGGCELPSCRWRHASKAQSRGHKQQDGSTCQYSSCEMAIFVSQPWESSSPQDHGRSQVHMWPVEKSKCEGVLVRCVNSFCPPQ